MGQLLSKDKVNTGRQAELDLAKFLALIYMILLHCLMVTYGFNNTISLFMQRGIWQLLGGPFAAPVFMFTMGVGMVYSRNQDPNYLIKRGVKTMLLGLVVNIGEFFLPHYLAGKLLGEWDIFPIAGGLLLFCVDILAFAGMSMIMIGLLKKLNISAGGMVIIAIIMSIAGTFLRFRDLGGNVPNLIAGYFIGSAGGFTAFPLFNWFIFPSSGLLFGEYYIRCNDKKRLLRFWPLALVISVAYFVASWFMPEGFLSETHHYYFMTTIDAAFCLLCIYGVIGSCNLICGYLPDGAIKFISKASGNINEIYIIQWFLIPVTYILIVYFIKGVVFSDLSLIIIALIEITVTTALAAKYKDFKKSK